jgi:hypothetical protein
MSPIEFSMSHIPKLREMIQRCRLIDGLEPWDMVCAELHDGLVLTRISH